MGDTKNPYSELFLALERANEPVHNSLNEMRVRAGAKILDDNFRESPDSIGVDFPGLDVLKLIVAPLAIVGCIGSSPGGAIGCLPLLVVFAVMYFLQDAVLGFLGVYWKTILLVMGGMCVGAIIPWLASRVGKNLLKKIEPPNAKSDEPTKEIDLWAKRSSKRLQTMYWLQAGCVLVVFCLLVGNVVWTIALLSEGRVESASAFGSGGIVTLVLSRLIWNPFERIAESRKLADNADILSVTLVSSMRDAEKIPNMEERRKAVWDDLRNFLELS
jgi:hypothetical protein